MPDPEIEAMSQVVAALDSDSLDDDARMRVLRWAGDRYGLSISHTSAVRTSAPAPDAAADERPARVPDVRSASEPVFEAFVDFFDAVDPKSETDKALTAAYWLQVISKQPSWQSLRVNNLLKEMGHGVPNVTSALRSAQQRKPALVRQVAKSGRAAQSWKTYKLTTSGVSHVRRMLGLPQTVPAAMQDHGDDED
jgi:hypothetical protein